MLLQSGAERVLDIADLEDSEPKILASVRLRIDRENGDLLSRDIMEDRNLSKVSSTALNVGYHSKLWA